MGTRICKTYSQAAIDLCRHVRASQGETGCPLEPSNACTEAFVRGLIRKQSRQVQGKGWRYALTDEGEKVVARARHARR